MVDTTRYNTGNELGSNKLEDLSDNAKNIDNFANGGNETFPDRFGVVRKSIAGMESDHIDQINAHEIEHDKQISAHEIEHDNQIARHESEFITHIERMGWTPVAGSFQAGGTITDRNQTLYDEVSQVFYAWGGALPKVVPAGSTPATAGGVGVGLWSDKTDLTLRNELSLSTGATKVGTSDGRTVEQRLAAIPNELSLSTGATKVGTSDGRTVEQRLAALPNELETALAASAYIKDASRHAVERASGGRQTVLYDDLGNPSIMNIIPVFRYEDLGYIDDMGTGVVSCFDVGTGANKSEIFIGAFQSSLVGSRAVSLPRENPATSVNFDTAKGYCANKGAGWHLMTMHEWAAISLWCMANGFEPRGNTNYGRAIDRYVELGRRVDGGLPGVSAGTTRVYTGSGPDAWRHNNSPWGISDLVGNVWEWLDGFKLQNGQIIASTFNTQAEASWAAQAAYFDSTLTNGGSPRLSNAVVNRLGTIDNNMDSGYIAAADFKSIEKTGTYVSNQQLKRLLVEPSTALPKGRVPMRNFGERLPCRGGSIGTGAGLAALDLRNSRVFTGGDIGFRLAFSN